MLPGRPRDRFGLSFMYARYSAAARGFDADAARLTPEAAPRRSFEANLELTYLAEIMPGWDVLPTAVHVWNPSEAAGARNAVVVGLRTRLLY